MRVQLALLALAFALANTAAIAETVEVHGSTTVSSMILNPKKAEIEKAAGVELQIVGNGSGRGLADLIEGKVKLAMISAPLGDEMKALKAKGATFNDAMLKGHQVGASHIAFVVHPSNSVKSLTGAQMTDVLSGKIKNWSEVGGPDKPIMIVCAAKGDGLRSMVEKEFLGGGDITAAKREMASAPQALQVVAQLPDAIGIAPRKSVNASVAELKTDKDVVQPLILVTMGEPAPLEAKVIAAAKAVGGQ